ncbi:MAG: hypothetical protein V2I57_06610 [Xanthomonadales bacterium]|jgi:hypothetical protein|nr:hypothetical protein [Xanthomonadales bacterium]
MKSISLRNAIACALLAGASTSALAAPLGEHVNGFYQTPASEGTARGLGVQYIPSGPDQGVLFVAYYAYSDADGSGVWVAGSQAVSANDTTADVELFTFDGGNFGGGAGTPTGTSVGTGTFTFNACNDVSWSFTSTDTANLADFDDTLTNVVQANIPSASAPASCAAYTTPFEGCPDFAQDGAEPGTCIIPGGEITQDITLTNNTVWLLGGAVYIGERRATPEDPETSNSNSITIEAGTRIIGADQNTILGIQPGAKIIANGTANAPIVFTGIDGEDRGEWGGLTINGFAPLNVQGGLSVGEGESGVYGGDDPLDSSGVLRYVRVQYAGALFNDTNELNGIAFQGVGSGTVVENIQVHANEDDGVEFFGGTVNARNVVLTDVRDDSLDWTEGWTGRIQNLLVVQDRDFDLSDAGDRGIEADNLEDDNDATPRAKPWIANATFIGRPDSTGATLRRGTGVNLTNVIFSGFQNCLDIDNDATFTAAGTPPDQLTGNLTIQNSVVNCATNFVEEDGDPWTVQSWFEADGTNQEVDPQLENLVFLPAGSDLESGFPIDFTIFDSFFQNQDYVGAFGPGPAWTAGWTLQNYTK